MLLDTPVCDFDWPAPDFQLDDAHGTAHRLADYADAPLLLAFICNHCPYVQRIADAFAKTTAHLAEHGVNTVAIMSNDYTTYPDDSPLNMIRFADQHGFTFPYLVDADQSVGRAYGAVCTPDFFGFNAKGGLQYRGRFVDPQSGAPELYDAMIAIANTGQGPRDQTPSMGCSIKWSTT